VKASPDDEAVPASQNDTRQEEIAEIIAGLSQPQKMISPKYFYDERGSALFEQICELPEYYLTRTEIDIMQAQMDEISKCTGAHASVIEFGSGAGLKTRMLLKNLEHPVAYLPVDISGDHLLAASSEIAAEFPAIEILPVAADFTRPFPLPAPRKQSLRNLVYFPGSTIGNFPPDAAHRLLRVMHQEAGRGGALLIGVDLKKDSVLLEQAYNDEAGVTAEFNLNILKRLNREFGSGFKLESFRHHAFYNPSDGRIEMHLVSQTDQRVSMADSSFEFEEGESIITEYSYKYKLDEFEGMAAQAGFKVEKVWTDPNQWFSIHYCRRD
jgi:dimethylhistidine N-methyltransferase